LLSLGLDFLVDDEYEPCEEDLLLGAGFEPKFCSGLLLTLFTSFSGLEKAASSIFLLVLAYLFDLEEGRVKSSVFVLDEDRLEGLERSFPLRLEVCPLADGRVPLLLSWRLIRLSPKFEDPADEDS
tara:strand:- start:109 stop:486 length:378 start_codon:yes stop_codon:yes gene_type:complete